MSLKVSNLVKHFGPVLAVNDLSLELPKPGVYALLGSNGAGKTTSIRIILGMLAKDGGTVEWNGRPLRPAKENIGYLSEERGLYAKVKIAEQMRYFAMLKGTSSARAKEQIRYYLDRFGITEHEHKRAEQLSKGNQQKVQLASALVSDPPLLILDEPLSGLDPVNADLFKTVIREEISRGKYIILSSHQMATVEEFCHGITIMHRGATALQGDLNYIKRGYGRSNLTVKLDGGGADIKNALEMAAACGLELQNETPELLEFKVPKEAMAHELLAKLVGAGKSVIRFELREPSLHEIFVETVTKAQQRVAADSAT